MSALAVVLALAVEQARLLAVHVERLGSRAALSVETSSELGRVSVRREGDEVILLLGVSIPETLVTPPVIPPIEEIRLGREPDGLALRVRVAPEVPYAVRREGARLTVVFGADDQAKPAPRESDVDRLYRGLFPPSGGPLADTAGIVPPGGEASAPGEPAEGLTLGALTLRPLVVGSYVDADNTFLDSPEPLRDTYFQLEPKLAAELPLPRGRLTADYGPRLRRGSTFALVERTSHFANAVYEAEGSTLGLRLNEHFAHGVLETYEVDPGGEYFFGLGVFTRNTAEGSLRLGRGGRLGVELGGGYTKVDVDETSSFFDYESWSARGGLGYDATPNLHASLLYGYQRTPASAERPQSEQRTHSVSLDLAGEILPLLNGRFSVGYASQDSPRAGPGGTRFDGLTLAANLTKEFTPSTALDLTATRGTQLSAFEDDAFYVSNAVGTQLRAPLGAGITVAAAAGYHWNEYKTTASALGVPREDRIFGWSIGLGRTVTRRAYVRADYRRERRDSNVEDLDVTVHGLVIQVGVGFFGTGR